MPSGVIDYIRGYKGTSFEADDPKYVNIPYFVTRLGCRYEVTIYFSGHYDIHDCYGNEMSKEHLPKRISSIADAKEVFDYCENLPKCV